jgi:hypothetical protein
LACDGHALHARAWKLLKRVVPREYNCKEEQDGEIKRGAKILTQYQAFQHTRTAPASSPGLIVQGPLRGCRNSHTSSAFRQPTRPCQAIETLLPSMFPMAIACARLNEGLKWLAFRYILACFEPGPAARCDARKWATRNGR